MIVNWYLQYAVISHPDQDLKSLLQTIVRFRRTDRVNTLYVQQGNHVITIIYLISPGVLLAPAYHRAWSLKTDRRRYDNIVVIVGAGVVR